jgi:very-short-patch-repair endonuclease
MTKRTTIPRVDKADIFASLWKMLAPAGAPEPEREYQFNQPESKHKFDFAWPKWKVAVEVDGGQWQAHGGRHAHDDDKIKGNLAVERGWRVLHYSPEMLKQDPQGVITQVVMVLTTRCASVPRAGGGSCEN